MMRSASRRECWWRCLRRELMDGGRSGMYVGATYYVWESCMYVGRHNIEVCCGLNLLSSKQYWHLTKSVISSTCKPVKFLK